MGKERSAGFLVFRRTNGQIEYLLLKASEMGMHWGPPKGHVERDEDDITTAARETQEEAGYTVNDLDVHREPYKMRYKVGENDKTVVYYPAELKNVKKEPKLCHEHTEFCWVTKDEAMKLTNFVHFTKMVDHLHHKIDKL
ncbi:Bis(5'-nucleosyl)-tetraphosphatase [asymmetrical] [Pseudolycoriella hygida]|uniref:Bis(5'-nucleosyl)-tetraphosphatase [asymmetrical] n=1 Tax=Pseudolycoriella hygida TaxID=35572 RepID=A0A9Q0S5K9_9DIPT|nr:Bis(5'-nucleosyl)-tetraphosphatase [asymmetrical] [Pseudolycoriella hygida]